MRRFFPRLFLVIWLAATLVGASVTMLDALANPPAHLEEQHRLICQALRLEAIEVMKQAQAGDSPDARLARFRDLTGATIYLVRDDGEVFAPKPPSDGVLQLAERVRREGEVQDRRDNATLVGITLPNNRYVAVGRVWRTPAWARALGEGRPAIRLLLLLGASALLALVLARYLTRPVRTLSAATARIADGDLDARVAPELGGGALAGLGRDFDRMAERVQELLAARERLLIDVSHELNSPLSRQRVALELLRRRLDSLPDQASEEVARSRAAVDRIEREATRLAALVEEILAFARLEAAEAGSDVFDLAALVGEVAEDARYEGQALRARVALAGSGLERAALIAGDRALLRRAIDNVVRNALRFTSEGSEVEVAVQVSSERASVVVRDYGPGVPDLELEAIFDPLYRVDAARGRADGLGTGLGLSIARRAVALHGGTIVAENADGGGLRVTLALPLASETGGLRADASRPEVNRAG